MQWNFKKTKSFYLSILLEGQVNVVDGRTDASHGRQTGGESLGAWDQVVLQDWHAPLPSKASSTSLSTSSCMAGPRN